VLYSDHEAEVARLAQQLAAETVRADFAWKNTREIDKARQADAKRLVQAEDDVCSLHRIGSLEALKRIAAECAKRDYCSCAPLEMSYCVTERFVAQLEAQAARLAQAEALLRAAVTPHAFNCGWIRHPDFIKMVPVYKCTCGLDAFLAASGEQYNPDTIKAILAARDGPTDPTAPSEPKAFQEWLDGEQK
jgi:hypothetical protein